MLSTHSLSSSARARTSALVEMEVRGVLSSCPASVMNCFCSSIFFTYGSIARREKAETSANISSRLSPAVTHDTISSVRIA